MRKIIFFLIVLFFFNLTKAQVYVGYNNISDKYVDPNNKDLERLKSSTTIFALPNQLLDYEDEIEKIFKEVWTVSKFEIIKYNDLNGYLNSNGNYSFLTLDVLGYRNSYNFFSSFYQIYFNLWMNGNTRKVWSKYNATYGRINLSLTEESVEICKGLFKKDLASDSYKKLYTKATFFNLTPGFLRTYLTVMNKVLSNDKIIFYVNEGVKDKEKFIPLSKETLYIPEYILVKYDKSKKILKEKLDIKELMADYPYKWELISSDDLSKKILEKNEKFYYVVYSIDDISRSYSVYNSSNSELIFADADNKGGFDAKSKFFKSLGKKIRKAIK
ncbi:MAG: hypothetical protein NTZ33_01500 [Bacteroidetes bacterium]|nr:hypothetical protein [Bacteroidota bacterium]